MVLPPHRFATARSTRGFTLIELMIVVAIVGILAMVAYPSFMEQVRKSRRSDAIGALAQIQQAQERWRANNTTYTTDLSSAGLKVSNPSSGYYTLAVSGVSATGYTATATKAGAQASDGKCATLTLTMAAGTLSYSSTGTATGGQCWNR
jgi:type IV pilus assembly protein PilE